jgi:hypothetical protein
LSDVRVCKGFGAAKRALYEPLFTIIPLIRDLGQVLLGRFPVGRGPGRPLSRIRPLVAVARPGRRNRHPGLVGKI